MNRMRLGPGRRARGDDSEDLLHRLLAAVVAAPMFELALALALSAAGGQGAVSLMLEAPLWVHGLYAGLAAGIGLVFGFKGLTWLMGHLFMTHGPDERSTWTTGLLWAAFAGLVAVGFFATVR